jgi:hypothetical protein
VEINRRVDGVGCVRFDLRTGKWKPSREVLVPTTFAAKKDVEQECASTASEVP